MQLKARVARQPALYDRMFMGGALKKPESVSLSNSSHLGGRIKSARVATAAKRRSLRCMKNAFCVILPASESVKKKTQWSALYQAGSHKNTVPVACGLRRRSYVFRVCFG
jgi:hypothetical protein